MTDEQRKELERIFGPGWHEDVLRTAREVCGEDPVELDPTALAPAPWSYEPSGDSDGFTIGTDHFVLDYAGNEIACAPNAPTARCMAAGPEMVTALRAFIRMDDKGEEVSGGEWNSAIVLARAAMAKVKGTRSEDGI